MTYRSLTLTLEGAVAVVRRTAGDGFLGELSRAATDLADNDAVHIVLLTADPGTPALGVGAADAAALMPLEQMPQPVLACIDGDVRDAELELLLACDIRIAGPDATFGLTSVARGEVPSLGGTQRLPRLVGRAQAELR